MTRAILIDGLGVLNRAQRQYSASVVTTDDGARHGYARDPSPIKQVPLGDPAVEMRTWTVRRKPRCADWGSNWKSVIDKAVAKSRGTSVRAPEDRASGVPGLSTKARPRSPKMGASYRSSDLFVCFAYVRESPEHQTGSTGDTLAPSLYGPFGIHPGLPINTGLAMIWMSILQLHE